GPTQPPTLGHYVPQHQFHEKRAPRGGYAADAARSPPLGQLVPRAGDDDAVAHVNRTRRLARPAVQAQVQSRQQRRIGLRFPFRPRLCQLDAAPGRMFLDAEHLIRRARGQAETALNAAAGFGMGMTRRQLLWMVEIPHALPVILAGIRTSAVLNVGVATLAGLIGAGGFGAAIVHGIDLRVPPLVWYGAVPTALLAIIVDFFLRRLEEILTPAGLRIGGGH